MFRPRPMSRAAGGGSCNGEHGEQGYGRSRSRETGATDAISASPRLRVNPFLFAALRLRVIKLPHMPRHQQVWDLARRLSHAQWVGSEGL